MSHQTTVLVDRLTDLSSVSRDVSRDVSSGIGSNVSNHCNGDVAMVVNRFVSREDIR